MVCICIHICINKYIYIYILILYIYIYRERESPEEQVEHDVRQAAPAAVRAARGHAQQEALGPPKRGLVNLRLIIFLNLIIIIIIIIIMTIILIPPFGFCRRPSRKSSGLAWKGPGTCGRSTVLTDEIGTPDPQLEPQITSLDKCKIS